MLGSLSREAIVGMLFTRSPTVRRARIRQARRMTTLFGARIAHGLQERGHVGDVVGVARRCVAGESGFDVNVPSQTFGKAAVRLILALTLVLNLR